MLFHRADQPDAPLDLAIVEHEARRRDLHGAPAGALIDQQHGAVIGETTQGFIERDRPIALALRYGQQPGLRTRPRMGVNRAPVGNSEALGAQRFQPDVIGAGWRSRPRCGRSATARKP